MPQGEHAHAHAHLIPAGQGDGAESIAANPAMPHGGMAIIETLMAEYARTQGDTGSALGRVLPLLAAVMGSTSRLAVFLDRETGGGADCVAATGTEEDTAAPRITAPLRFGNRCFGMIVAESAGQDRIADTDYAMLVWLGTAIACALENLQLVDRILRDRMIRRDRDETNAARAALNPVLDGGGYIAARTHPQSRIAGDFFDYLYVGGRLVFCQGDVGGAPRTGGSGSGGANPVRGILAGLRIAKLLAVFRQSAREGLAVAIIARNMHAAHAAPDFDSGSGFAVGMFDPADGTAEVINCGHNLLLLAQEPHGHAVVACGGWRGNLARAALYMASDGMTGAKTQAASAWGAGGLVRAMRSHAGLTAAGRVSAVMRRLMAGSLVAHDDATLLVVSGIGRGICLENKAKRIKTIK